MNTSEKMERYKVLYLDLGYLLKQGYKDIFFLKGIEDYKTRLKESGKDLKPHISHIALSHMCELAKMDLCITVWKLLYDNDRDANSLMTLNCFVRELTGKNYETKISKELNKNRTVICNIRNKMMAHNDKNRDLESISVSVLGQILEEIRIRLNAMCEKELCPEVFEYSDAALYSDEFRYRVALRELLKNDER